MVRFGTATEFHSVSATYILQFMFFSMIRKLYQLLLLFITLTIFTVLGFGANILTIVLVATIGVGKRSVKDGNRVCFVSLQEKLLPFTTPLKWIFKFATYFSLFQKRREKEKCIAFSIVF